MLFNCINILNVGSDHNNKTITIQRGGPIIKPRMRRWVWNMHLNTHGLYKYTTQICHITFCDIYHSFYSKKMFEDP